MQPADTDLFGEPWRDLEQSQLFTPPWLARRMIGWVPRDARVLEPACGTGNLLEALVHRGHRAHLLLGVERDLRMVDFATKRFEGQVAIRWADFFALELAPLDVVLMNPPYEENEHLRFVLAALDVAPVVVGLFPSDFEFTQERDSKLWATRGVVTHRALLPERVKFTKDGGQNEHVALRIARRMRNRRHDDERVVYEQTWRPGDGDGLAEVP